MTIRSNVIAAAGVFALLAGGALWGARPDPRPNAPAAPAAEAKGDSCCAQKGHGAAGEHRDCGKHADHGSAAAGPKGKKGAACPHLAAAKSGPASREARARGATEEWTCPMHPEVTAAKKDRCPKCGMFLEKRG